MQTKFCTFSFFSTLSTTTGQILTGVSLRLIVLAFFTVGNSIEKKTVRFSVTGSLFFSQVRVADLPGLIEGAAANRGLGHAFLKHTEKAKALALVVNNTSLFRDLILGIHS